MLQCSGPRSVYCSAHKRQPRTVASAILEAEGQASHTGRFNNYRQAAVSRRSSERRQREPSARLESVQPAKGQQLDWLAKVLASAGLASRRNCIELVKQGAVKVNGQLVTDPATKVDPSKDVLAAHGRIIKQPATVGYHYFAINKPPGYICSNASAKAPGKRAVDILQPWVDDWQKKHPGQLPPRLFTVGRLDVATSGLIFITNDGDWANKVIHPSANVIKEYHVTLPQQPTLQQLQLLRAGTAIDGVHCQPKVVTMLRQAGICNGGQESSNSGTFDRSKDSGRCILRIDVSEGKKHEVRLLVAAAGLEVLALKRVRVGGFVMPRNIKRGGYM